MRTISLEILLILFLILVNGVFAMSEIAVVSARKARLRMRAEAGDRGAEAALELARAPDRFLSTIQIGITLVGVLAGAYGGATIAGEIEQALSPYAWIAPYGQAVGVGIVVVGVTYFSLILGELVPKRIALNNPEKVASLVAPTMRKLSRIASPAVRVLTVSMSAVLRLFRLRPSTEPPVTEDEIKVLIEQGAEAGVFDVREKDIVSRVFRLADRPVAAVMTPRSEIDWIDLEDPPEETLRTLRESGRTRLPVARGELDRIEGVIRVVDWVRSGGVDPAATLASVARPASFVPESAAALSLLKQFQESRHHLLIVLDEHGSVAGLATLHDIMEAIVGELPHIDEPSEPLAIEREDGSWLVDGSLPIEEFEDRFRVPLREGAEGGFHTVGGLVMTALGRIPRSGDYFETSGLRIEVVDMDGNRVDKVLVTPPLEMRN